LDVDSFPGDIFIPPNENRDMSVDTSRSLSDARKRCIDQFESQYLRDQLAAHAGSIGGTAKAAGITTRQLHKLMQKHSLHKEDFKTGILNSDFT
jgi:DNA-binding NtrC family response regulator